MSYQTLLITNNPDIPHLINITLNRLEHRNSLNKLLISELHDVLDQIEKNPDCRMVILKGQQGIFCTGMDFKEASQSNTEEGTTQSPSEYMDLLKRFTLIPKIIVTEVDGEVMAGGMGLVVASDLAIGTTRSKFTLSEALWGLLPANLMPFLIRRIGFQKAYLMTLTTQTVTAVEAHAIHLIDELSDQPEEILRKYALRLSRLNEQTIRDLKQYFRKMWIINESMEQIAIHELARLMQEPRIRTNIKRFVEQGKFPWEEITDDRGS